MGEIAARYTAEQTAAYIDYLQNTHNLDISIHMADKYSYILFCDETKGLAKYNVHTNPYCFHVKSDDIKHRKCLKCQWAAINKCRSAEWYTGVCHAAVREYIRRICINGEAAGFISVSGYRAADIPQGTDTWYDSNMRTSDIPVTLLGTVIPPLCIMLEHLIMHTKNNESDDVYLRILSYLSEHHSHTTLDELSERFNYSKSYISHIFRKRSGYTLKRYCNILKIKDAKLMLQGTDMSVTDIAFSAGFNDFSYFINTFKSIEGTTPLQWRKVK